MPDRKALVVTAHPDDEAIFFFATLERLKKAGASVLVLCATGDFGSGFKTVTRLEEFQESCRRCGVEGQSLGLEDARGRPLCMDQLRAGLRSTNFDLFDCVYTHGPWGDYGHLHHVSVCYAVHEVFGERALALAGPLLPQVTTVLEDTEYLAKLEHMKTCYPSQSFAWSWATRCESFARIPPLEAMFMAHVALGEEICGPPWSTIDAYDLESLASTFIRVYSGPRESMPSELRQIPEKVWRNSLSSFCINLQRRAQSGWYRYDCL